MISHLPGPAIVDAPTVVHRVARSDGDGALHLSRITPQDAALERAGNRFDVVGGGVLYAASTLEACYVETLARFRVSTRIRAVVEELDAGRSYVVCGGVPADWRARRVKAEIALVDPLPFVDVESPVTHEYLSGVLAPRLASYLEGPLDVAAVRGPDRRVTREIASWAYAAVDGEGNALYSGIRYMSRLDSSLECWAVFDGTQMQLQRVGAIPVSGDDDLARVADLFGLRIF